MNNRNLLRRLAQGQTNVRFGDLVRVAEALGFRHDRTRGGHHIYLHPVVRERLNLQNDRGQAKPYQVRQLLKLVEEYNLSVDDR